MSAVERTLNLWRASSPGSLLCVVGPTASGKTSLAIALAREVGGEVISADSVQIYRGFDIGSGKATEDEMAGIPHHFVSTHDPHDHIDAAAWAKLAAARIEDIRARGRVPIVCGGTYFWVRALVLGLVAAPAADAEIRARHRAIVDTQGRTVLHAELARIDPPSAARIHPNDVVRVSRALEIHELSGRTMTEWHAEHGFQTRQFEATTVALDHTPAALTARIAERVDAMLARGFIDEVAHLLAKGHRTARAMDSVGYAEVRAHLDGALPRSELRDAIVRNTRVFARKQRTWLKQAEVIWLSSTA